MIGLRSSAVAAVVVAAALASNVGPLQNGEDSHAATAPRAECDGSERLAVVGDSMLAGFASGGLVRRGNPGQADGLASLLARAAKARLRLPAIDAPAL